MRRGGAGGSAPCELVAPLDPSVDRPRRDSDLFPRIARESRGAWSYATVWRVAARAGIELTAGRRTMGRPRLPPEKRVKVEQAVAAHPGATQEELARQCGVSRSTVGRVVRARRAALQPAG